MFGDNGPALDQEALDDALREAEVVVLAFDFTADRLLFDLRDDPRGRTPPIVELVEPLGNAQERHIWLSARRPGLRVAEELLFLVWPHSVSYLATSPFLSSVVDRIRREQGVDVRESLDDAIADLRHRERSDLFAAVRGGEGFETLWSRGGN